jgi:hypothetical protein
LAFIRDQCYLRLQDEFSCWNLLMQGEPETPNVLWNKIALQGQVERVYGLCQVHPISIIINVNHYSLNVTHCSWPQ